MLALPVSNIAFIGRSVLHLVVERKVKADYRCREVLLETNYCDELLVDCVKHEAQFSKA